jgi:hypothetical protein
VSQKLCYTDRSKKVSTVAQWRAANISKDGDSFLRYSTSVYCSLTVHESLDFTSTAQTYIFARDVPRDFEVLRIYRSPFNARPYKGIGFHSGITVWSSEA